MWNQIRLLLLKQYDLDLHSRCRRGFVNNSADEFCWGWRLKVYPDLLTRACMLIENYLFLLYVQKICLSLLSI